VICELIDPALLRAVRTEIQQNLSFTPKETDIYKIHQSGDLANLDGLEDSSLKLLPSLLQLRDALYSSAFREYLSAVTDSGPLSGKKTDMAINVYTPGCHLLCHDDVIGSRRVSYILYLTDPDRPWKPEWGGALRLYPTQTFTGADGQPTKTPSPDFSVSIPPAFNQLSFFAVQPGESFHDVEEVYARSKEEKEEDDGGRVRMAISGWYHIPQKGEDGYEEGLEERLAEKSSLVQLQGKADRFDFPEPRVRYYHDESTAEKGPSSAVGNGKQPQQEAEEDEEPTEQELDFLLKYLTPTYLTPDTLGELSELFADESSLRLDSFLSKEFCALLRQHLEEQESQLLPPSSTEIEKRTGWSVARPPHKHRFLYQQPRDVDPIHNASTTSASAPASTSTSNASAPAPSPVQELTEILLPSRAFRKWLVKATGLKLTSYDVMARRFRRGLDYTLATGYEEETSRLELTLGITPTSGWGDDEDDNAVDEETQTTEHSGETAGKDHKGGAKAGADADAEAEAEVEAQAPGINNTNTTPPIPVGGYEVYMAGDGSDSDSDSDGDSDGDSDHGVTVPSSASRPNPDPNSNPNSKTNKNKNKNKTKADPAIYKSGNGGDDEDDGVLFSMPAGWNRLSVVLRDRGVLRFVKFVSRGARGDRWDVVGGFGVEEEVEAEQVEVGDGDRDGDGEEGPGVVGNGRGVGGGAVGVGVGVGIGDDESESESLVEEDEEESSSDD